MGEEASDNELAKYEQVSALRLAHELLLKSAEVLELISNEEAEKNDGFSDHFAKAATHSRAANVEVEVSLREKEVNYDQ